MPTHEDTAYLFAYVSPGERHSAGERLIPVPTDDGGFVAEPHDGVDLVRARARRLLRHVGVVQEGMGIMELGRAFAAPLLLFAQSDFDLIVTDSRVVILGNRPRADGSRVAGQVRFPWIASVGFRPKQSFLNDSELVIEAYEDYDIDGFPERQTGYYRHQLTFVFEKTFHPGDLARTIAQRAARYVAATQSTPDAVGLAVAQESPVLPDPPKGEHAEYDTAIRCSVPGGAYLLDDDDAVTTTWTVTT